LLVRARPDKMAPMRVVGLAICGLLVSSAAWAQFAGNFVWNPRVAPKLEKGDRIRVEASRKLIWEFTETIARDDSDTDVLRDDCKWAFVRTIAKVRRGKVTQEKYDIETFECIDSEGFNDVTLAGKSITVTIQKRGRKAQVAGVRRSKLTQLAKRWIDEVLLRDVDPLLDVVYPKAGVTAGDEWPVDPIDLAILWGLHEMSGIDPAGSPAAAKLINVRMDSDVHVGELRADIALKLGSFPKYRLRWRDGGTFSGNVTLGGPLAPSAATARTLEVRGELTGSAVGTLPSGERVTRQVKMTIVRDSVIRGVSDPE